MKLNRTWDELSPATKGALGVVGIVEIVLLGAALIDLRRRPADQIRGPKRLWLGLVFIDVVGPLAYFFYGRRRGA